MQRLIIFYGHQTKLAVPRFMNRNPHRQLPPLRAQDAHQKFRRQTAASSAVSPELSPRARAFTPRPRLRTTLADAQRIT